MIKPAWLWGPPVRADVVPKLQRAALDRMRVFAPIGLIGILTALALSIPSGVPLPALVIAINVGLLLVGLVLSVQLARDRVPLRVAHPISAVIWLLAPATTLASYIATHQATLVLPLMIGVATAALCVDTAWTLCATLPVLALGIPLSLEAGRLPVYPLALCGIWLVAMIMQVGLRRTLIHAETHRLDVESTARELAHELDERRRAEADRERLRDQFVHAQRMDAVGTLAAGLAHDMNNILGGILAYAEVLHAEATDQAVRSDLARIRQEAERGAALTRSLVAFSRRGQYRKRAILLHSVLDDMMPLVARTLGRNIIVARTDGPPTIIDGDPAQLGQVVLNLCMNASDAMNGNGTLALGTDEIEVADHAKLAPGRYAKLVVRDTGSGMDADTQRRAFEPFFTTKPLGKGTGLGLAMVFGAVEAHGGTIEIESILGKGTAMTILLPATEANPTLPASSAEGTAPRVHGRVMIVDDEPIVRSATARLVKQLGLDALTASDGEEALVLYKIHQDEIVLILLDMVMPKLAGPECYRELRKLGTTPVLIVSGYASDAVTQALIEEGAEGFLEKPYTALQLGAEIDRILGKRA
jgi:signal transduction histidine kinase/CheY-like chemotaxis protein